MTRQRSIAALVIATAMTAALCAHGQYRDWIGDEEQTARSRWIPKLQYIEVDADAERDSFHYSNGLSESANRFYVSPRLALGWDNYVYHPNLLMYNALFEPGYMWRHESFAGDKTTTDELTLLGRLNAELLSQKPYAATLTFDRAHDEVQYGFFNSAAVDSQSWGIATGYRDGPVPVRMTFHQSHEDADELTQKTITDENSIDLRAQNERIGKYANNATYFTYNYLLYNRETLSNQRDTSTENSSHRVDIQDTENFERSILRSDLRFNERETGNTSVSDIAATANYDLDITDRVKNYDQASYSQFMGDGFDSKNASVSTGLRHQLYESLSSGLDLHGSWNSDNSGGGSTGSTSGGITWSEDYTKRLSSWGRMSFGNSASYGLNHQDLGGGSLLIANETHVIPPSDLVRLSRAKALTLVSVTDSNNIPLDAPSDYTLIRSEPWQIRINPFSTRVKAGDTVQVTYTVQTAPTASSTSFGDGMQVRLSLWDELASFYARYSFTDNHSSSPDIVVENETVFQTGATLTWHRLGLNADYTDQRSTFYKLSTFNLAESYSFDLSRDQTLGLVLNQQWGRNTGTSGPVSARFTQNSVFYNAMVNYEWRPTQHLSWKSEVGYQYQSGFNMRQNLLAARSYLTWILGKMQISGGYEHESLDYRHESKLRDYVFVKLRRNF